MKIKELIEELSKLDPELFVFVAGYEGGFTDAYVSPPAKFQLNVNDEWYYGPHEMVRDSEIIPDGLTVVNGIVV